MEPKDNGKDNHASVACSSRRRGKSGKTWSASDLVALLRTQTPTLDTSQETKGRQVECITRTCI
ncbi:hypothetical protein M0657_011085 [Pyricularia oryzae]|nr:hypothetical protein M0657_011085 [Pyricularia oryzae]KAI7911180.1 hypothetical protein M9X92_010673 [Pyricularia oryzae]